RRLRRELHRFSYANSVALRSTACERCWRSRASFFLTEARDRLCPSRVSSGYLLPAKTTNLCLAVDVDVNVEWRLRGRDGTDPTSTRTPAGRESMRLSPDGASLTGGNPWRS